MYKHKLKLSNPNNIAALIVYEEVLFTICCNATGYGGCG